MKKIYHVLLSRWELIFLIFIIVLYTITFSTLSILRHDAFFSGFDLGNMDQTIWETGHGYFFSLTGEHGIVSRFSIHADIILILLAPLYFLWDNVRFLLILQSFLLALGSIPVFLLGKKILHSIHLGFLFVGIYLLHPSLEWANMYDFHTMTISIPFVLFAFYFAYVKKWKLFYLCVVLILLCREDLGLTVAGMGVIIFFMLQKKIIGTSVTVIGIAWFFLMTAIFIPHFSLGNNIWSLAFFQFSGTDNGGQPVTIFSTLIILAQRANQLLISGYAFQYYALILKPFAFLPLIGLPLIIPSLPIIMINVLSSKAIMVSSILHYESGIIPFFVISSMFGFTYLHTLFLLNKRIKPYANQIMGVFAILLLMYVLRDTYANAPLPINPHCFCEMYTVTNDDKQFEAVLQQIPQDAVVSASPEIRSHLTHRDYAFALPWGQKYATYIAAMTENHILGDTSPKPYENTLIKQLHASAKYQLVYHKGIYYLYKKV